MLLSVDCISHELLDSKLVGVAHIQSLTIEELKNIYLYKLNILNVLNLF